MAERRSTRSASRRITPTPPPPARAATRARGARSASREVDPAPGQLTRPTRRSARQASVASVASVASDASETDFVAKQPAPKTKRRAAKELVQDLTAVEELDPQLDLEPPPGTPPPPPQAQPNVPHHSPAGVSEISGTTAISSFSTGEAEFLEPRLIVRHLSKLEDIATTFLNHLVPVEGDAGDDRRNIKDAQLADSDFNVDYEDHDAEFALRLKNFQVDENEYIRPRSIHRALFGAGRDVEAARTGLDLVLYLSNVLIFAKQIFSSISYKKDTKEVRHDMWRVIRQLDLTFPGPFMSAIASSTNRRLSLTGESALLEETFDLALELRTQLVIRVLQHSTDQNADLDEVLYDVFFHSKYSQVAGSGIRGWSDAALGDATALPRPFLDQVAERVESMRQLASSDTESLEQDAHVSLDKLAQSFPWESAVYKFLNWARLRTRELQAAIHEQGGISTIVKQIKAERERPAEQPRVSPRKKRTSFNRKKRRSSGRFDPNAPVDARLVDALIARERVSDAGAEVEMSQEPPLDEVTNDVELPVNVEDEWQPAPVEDYELQEEEVQEQMREEEPEQEPQREPEPEVEDMNEPQKEAGPPQSTADILRTLKQASRVDKENRNFSIFDRRPDATRLEFGDGFDTESDSAAPGPSNIDKGKQRAEPPSKKRRREPDPDEDEDSDSDDDAFETVQRGGSRVEARRQKAPVTKKVRIEPTSSGGAPTSHQPPPEPTPDPQSSRRTAAAASSSGAATTSSRPTQPSSSRRPHQHAPPSPNASENEQPATSTFQDQRNLAHRRVIASSLTNGPQSRKRWTPEAEAALVQYMHRYPQRYALILEEDQGMEGEGHFEGRSQVNLKDKVRNMAITMIKSGTGLRPGFENVVAPNSVQGRKLLEEGYEW